MLSHCLGKATNRQLKLARNPGGGVDPVTKRSTGEQRRQAQHGRRCRCSGCEGKLRRTMRPQCW